jgi:hypothetical protein
VSGLKDYERDTAVLAAAGDSALAPPAPARLLELVDAHLARAGAARPIAAHWSYARWKPATSLTAGFELVWADGERRWVTWKRYVDGKSQALLGRRERDVAPETADDRLREHCVLPRDGAHLWAPPYDRELPGLERALDLRRAKRWFLEQGLFPGRRVRSGSSRATLLRYKPERRAVLRLDLRLRPLEGGPRSGETLGARALPPHEARRVATARATWQDLADDVRAPRLVAFEEAAGLLYETWLELEEARADVLEDAPAAGELLARLHARAAPADCAPPATGLAGALEILGTQPGLVERARRAAAARESAAAPRVWTHGDFHPDQLARGRDGAWCLLDLDRLGAGAALDDLASWIADGLVAGRPQARARLLEGYVRAGGVVPERAALDRAVARELVQRAAGALRRLEVDALKLASQRLDLALALAPPQATASAARPLAESIPAGLDVARIELARDGALLLELAGAGEPRWARLGESGPELLRPDDDDALPLAASLRELRERGPLRVLAWRPGRRLVLEAGERVLKGFRRARFPESARRHALGVEFARAAGLDAPDVLEVDARRAALAMRRLGGARPALDPASSGIFERLGAALARFQSRAVPAELAQHDAAAELAVLDELAERTRKLFGAAPSGWPAAREAVGAALLRCGAGARVPAHRDLHDGQVLAAAERTALLDFDLLCAADAALDPANLLAHLVLRDLQGLAAPGGAQACAAAFRRGLGERAGAEALRLGAWQAVAFARLALVYRARPPWVRLCPRLVALAIEKASEVQT